MKKLLSILACVVLLAGCSSTSAADEFTSASVKNFYEESSLRDDALFSALDQRIGAPAVATVNPDGTPNLAVFSYGHLEEKYLLFSLSENQTLENIKNNKEGVALFYVYTPDMTITKFERNIGARITFKTVEDHDALLAEMMEKYPEKVRDTSYIVEIVEVLPLG